MARNEDVIINVKINPIIEQQLRSLGGGIGAASAAGGSNMLLGLGAASYVNALAKAGTGYGGGNVINTSKHFWKYNAINNTASNIALKKLAFDTADMVSFGLSDIRWDKNVDDKALQASIDYAMGDITKEDYHKRVTKTENQLGQRIIQQAWEELPFRSISSVQTNPWVGRPDWTSKLKTTGFIPTTGFIEPPHPLSIMQKAALDNLQNQINMTQARSHPGGFGDVMSRVPPVTSTPAMLYSTKSSIGGGGGGKPPGIGKLASFGGKSPSGLVKSGIRGGFGGWGSMALLAAGTIDRVGEMRSESLKLALETGTSAEGIWTDAVLQGVKSTWIPARDFVTNCIQFGGWIGDAVGLTTEAEAYRYAQKTKESWNSLDAIKGFHNHEKVTTLKKQNAAWHKSFNAALAKAESEVETNTDDYAKRLRGMGFTAVTEQSMRNIIKARVRRVGQIAVGTGFEGTVPMLSHLDGAKDR